MGECGMARLGDIGSSNGGLRNPGDAGDVAVELPADTKLPRLTPARTAPVVAAADASTPPSSSQGLHGDAILTQSAADMVAVAVALRSRKGPGSPAPGGLGWEPTLGVTGESPPTNDLYTPF